MKQEGKQRPQASEINENKGQSGRESGDRSRKPEKLNNRAEKVIPKVYCEDSESRAKTPAEERARGEDRVPALNDRPKPPEQILGGLLVRLVLMRPVKT